MKIIFEEKPFTHSLKTSVESLLNSKKTAKAEPQTFEEIRAALGKDAAELPDGIIHQIAYDLGLKVVPE